MPRYLAAALTAAALLAPLDPAAHAEEVGALVMDRAHDAEFRFGGPMGERVDANVREWLLVAPEANPGMLEMFRLRDTKPTPDLVPWAGEFVGKYLMSAIQACRMTDDPALRPYVESVIDELLTLQADDGYLGPFPKEERLLGHWDLWGHYHILLALLMWHEDTGDERVLDCARRIADLICDTYLDAERRPIDAGSHEMNLSVIHALTWLHRVSGEERYRRMADVIVEDWESAGDYYRTGVAGVDFHLTPRPRWESLGSLQGLLELHRVTGDATYRDAMLQHWRSIRDHDRHPSGAYSTREQSVGNPYSEGAIETCCTTAWMALTVDALRATGDPRIADELELSTWNSMLGSQHPSGRWWTYDTPMNGVRKASAHDIVFQARHGAPELNCCSVNAPRGLGMLSEWAVMLDGDGPVVNYYGPMAADFALRDGTKVSLAQETSFPADGDVALTLRLDEPTRFALRLRIPAWSGTTTVRVNGEEIEQASGGGALRGYEVVNAVAPGTYLRLEREWKDGDAIEVTLDLSIRVLSGALARDGNACVYAGPLLLALDQKRNPDLDLTDDQSLPRLDVTGPRPEPIPVDDAERFAPLALYRAATEGSDLTLCDFASAGAYGTRYRAWIPARNTGPAGFTLRRPRANERIPEGPCVFEWDAWKGSAAADARYHLQVARDAAFRFLVADAPGLDSGRYILEESLKEGEIHWRVIAENSNGKLLNTGGARKAIVDPTLPPASAEWLEALRPGADALLLASPLDGDGEPTRGTLESAAGVEPAADRDGREGGAVALSGEGSMLVYALPFFPEDDYTFLARARPEGLPTDRLQQIVSCWTAGMDDPLRVCFSGDALFGRIEAGGTFGTEGVPAANGEWIHVAVVKEGPELRLFVNGARVRVCAAPWSLSSSTRKLAIGGNPAYTGANECFRGRVDDLFFYARALTDDEIAQAYSAP